MAWLNFNYYFFMIIFLIIASLIYISIKYDKKVRKITLNPIDLILGIMFFLSLWLFDLVSLKMVDSGLSVLVGVTSGIKMSAPVVYIFSLLGMGVIAYYYSVENKRITKSLSHLKINRLFIRILCAGMIFSIILSLLMIFQGADFRIIIFDALGLYHLFLSLVIVSVTLLLLDLN